MANDDVIKWKHFPRYWPFVRGIHRSPVNSPHKGKWRGALMFFFDARLNKRLGKQSRRRWLRRYRAHYDVTVMSDWTPSLCKTRNRLPYSRCQSCWYPGSARNQDISSHNIDLFLPEYSDFSTRTVNSLMPRGYRRHFADDIFKYFSLNENVLISIKISLKFVPKGQINNVPASV